MNDVDIVGVECADIRDVDCIVKRLVEVEEVECIDILDVECVGERLIEVRMMIVKVYDVCIV